VRNLASRQSMCCGRPIFAPTWRGVQARGGRRRCSGYAAAAAAANASESEGAAASASAAAPGAVFDQAGMEKSFGRLLDQRQPNDSNDAGDTHIHNHIAVKGMISPDNLSKVVKKINRAVTNRQITLKSSDSLRVTRRSQ